MGYIIQRRSAWYEPRGEAMASPRGSYFSAAAVTSSSFQSTRTAHGLPREAFRRLTHEHPDDGT